MKGPINDLARILSRFPGLGPRSGRRIAITIAQGRKQIIPSLIDLLTTILTDVKECKICGNLDQEDECFICKNPKRDKQIVCIVGNVMDLWAIERMGQFKGVYHILGGLLSITLGVGPEHLNFNFAERAITAKEFIIALSPTLEGQTTSHYIQEFLKNYDANISTLALGLPMGGELDYLDEGTIAMALAARKSLS